MSLDPGWLLLSMVIGSIGTVLFMYGKRQTSLPHLLVGGIFFVYPYFVPNLLLQSSIAVLLGIGLWYAVRLGW